jgi:hypothetical protein
MYADRDGVEDSNITGVQDDDDDENTSDDDDVEMTLNNEGNDEPGELIGDDEDPVVIDQVIRPAQARHSVTFQAASLIAPHQDAAALR